MTAPKRPNLKKIFGKFSGRELGEPRGAIDPVLQEMDNAAKKAGLSLRVWFPGTAGTDDNRLDRVNAYVEQGKDGKFRVANKFNLG